MLVLEPYKGNSKYLQKIPRVIVNKTLKAVSLDRVWGMTQRTDKTGRPLFILMDDLNRGIVVKLKLYSLSDQEPEQ